MLYEHILSAIREYLVEIYFLCSCVQVYESVRVQKCVIAEYMFGIRTSGLLTNCLNFVVLTLKQDL